ncbi:MAG: peptidase [Candidatus Angelobacter sp.]|nr:peptidase [Candidatus Angelobacter sp.]
MKPVGRGFVIWLMAVAVCTVQPALAKKQAAAKKPATAASDERLHVSGARALTYVKDVVAFGMRPPGSPGQAKQQAYLRSKLKADNLEEDKFKAKTPVGEVEMTNFIAKYPGTTNDIIVISSHYDTLPSVKNFVGANDGGSSTALLLELANQLREHKRTGPAVWLVWFDGEEAFKTWTADDSTYGSRHLAAKWQQDGTLKRIKAFILADMIGDADLNVDHDGNSTPWLSDLVYKAASNLSRKSYFYAKDAPVEDDHIPFAKAGVPVVDLIDFTYGYNNVFWHTPEDTPDKLSANSLQIVGDVILETVRLLSTGQETQSKK